MENKCQIKLNAPEEVQEFVKSAGQCEFDIDVFYNRVVIDAKSILGVLSLDLSKILTVRYGGNNPIFEEMLEKYCVA
ncbi:HPr family phosphocarrier protein [Lachnospiraceae bacterium LCP25S3_G4]